MKNAVTKIVICLMLLTCTPRLHAWDKRDVWVLNNTGKSIYHVYIARHGTEDSWGSDVLGRSVLTYGEGSKIFFTGGDSSCNYDFRLVYSNGSTQDYLKGRDVCSAIAIQFNETENIFLS